MNSYDFYCFYYCKNLTFWFPHSNDDLSLVASFAIPGIRPKILSKNHPAVAHLQHCRAFPLLPFLCCTSILHWILFILLLISLLLFFALFVCANLLCKINTRLTLCLVLLSRPSRRESFCSLRWPLFEFLRYATLKRLFFFLDYYYCNYCNYCHYFSGKCCTWDIGIDGIHLAQGPFHSVIHTDGHSLVLGHTKYNSVQQVYYNPFPA
jgi:hypothetical protein